MRVPDNGTVIWHRKIKLKMIGVVISKEVCKSFIEDVKDLKFTACQLIYTFMKAGV